MGLVDGLRDAVLEAALAVLPIFNSRDFEVSSKGDAGPLTSADLLANELLRKSLSRLEPAAWLSEESADNSDRLSRKAVWIVDPIDGTREFVHHSPEFSISAGLAVNGKIAAGAVAMPAEDRIVYGSPQTGVFQESIRTGERKTCSLSPRRELDGAVLLVSATEFKKGTFDPIRDDFDVRPMGSIARKLALLAAGEGDLVVSFYPKNDWDICGGTALVLSHPGALVTDLRLFAMRYFNQSDCLSFGLAAGPEHLVREFHDYFRRKKIHLRENYGQ
jgi:myo-inositol-1(or 4)-monophosphatase